MHVKHFSTFLRIESAELMKDISAKQNEMEQNGKKKKKPTSPTLFYQLSNALNPPFLKSIVSILIPNQCYIHLSRSLYNNILSRFFNEYLDMIKCIPTKIFFHF